MSDRLSYAEEKPVVVRGARRDQALKHPHLLSPAARHRVACAGFLITRDGRLDYVDHSSGHYRPSVAHFLAFLRDLLGPQVLCQPPQLQQQLDVDADVAEVTNVAAWTVEVSPLLKSSAPNPQRVRLCAVPLARRAAALCEAAWLLRDSPLPLPPPQQAPSQQVLATTAQSSTPSQKARRAFVFVFFEGRGLLLLRTPEGEYKLPGGRREVNDECFEATALRELFEETGLELLSSSSEQRLRHHHHHHHHYRRRRLRRLQYSDAAVSSLLGDDACAFFELRVAAAEDDDAVVVPATAPSLDGLFVADDAASEGVALRLSPEHAGYAFEPDARRAELLLWASHRTASLALRHADWCELQGLWL
jgi:8-oxo-dGTP pyrophosphatase MutT (NUDIX family)